MTKFNARFVSAISQNEMKLPQIEKNTSKQALDKVLNDYATDRNTFSIIGQDFARVDGKLLNGESGTFFVQEVE